MCADCKEIFAENELKHIRHSDGDAWSECPHCGSDVYDDVEQCDECGKWLNPDSIHSGLCEDCLQNKAENKPLIAWYGYMNQTAISVNGLFAKVFTNGEIDEILFKVFLLLPENVQKKYMLDFVADDLPAFAECIQSAKGVSDADS